MNGIILAGGKSTRMETDKALLQVNGQTLLERALVSLRTSCKEVFISQRADQIRDGNSILAPILVDTVEGVGPVAAMLAACEKMPTVSWFVLACDFPFACPESVEFLSAAHFAEPPLTFGKTFPSLVTCYEHSDGTPEPLFAIWKPEGLLKLKTNFEKGITGPIQTLKRVHPNLVTPKQPHWIFNANTKADWTNAQRQR